MDFGLQLLEEERLLSSRPQREGGFWGQRSTQEATSMWRRQYRAEVCGGHGLLPQERSMDVEGHL